MEEERIFATVYHQKRTKRLAKMGQKIMQLLAPRHRLLFLEYERQVSLMQGDQIKSAYKIDGKNNNHFFKKRSSPLNLTNFFFLLGICWAFAFWPTQPGYLSVPGISLVGATRLERAASTTPR